MKNAHGRTFKKTKVYIYNMSLILVHIGEAVEEGGEQGKGHISLPSRFTVMIFNLNFHHQVLSISLSFQLCSCRILHVYRDIVP